MATVMNDRDVLLLGTAVRSANPQSSTILIKSDNPAFHVSASNVTTPSYITFKANLLGIAGTAPFTANGATIVDNHDNTATVAYNAMSGNSAVVTATITVNGQTYSDSTTVTKVYDGAQGSTGPAGNQYAIAYLYQWSTTTPSKPTGTTVYTWSNGTNTTYNASDNWSVTVPSNPGTPGLSLYVAAMPISATSATVTTTVSYTSSTVQAWTTNGAQGPQGNAGTAGMQSATINVYQWAPSIPAGPSGTSTYTWNGGAIGIIPSGWSATPGTATSQGMTLWAARVYLTDTATNTQTSFNWTSAAVIAVGYSGNNGAAGTAGASYVTAYCASTTATTTTAPAQTTGKTSLPATNDGGIVGAWSATVPSLTSGQYLYQTDGIYDPTTNKVTWSVPYWSSLKVGSLSAITANLGAINAGRINIGNSTAVINSDGSSIFRNITIGSSGGSTLIAPDGSGAIQNSINNAAITTFSPYATWDFTSNNGSWYGNNGTTITINPNSITITATNTDPMLDHDGLSFSGQVYDKVRVRIRRIAGAGWDGNLYFSTSAGEGEGVLGSGYVPNPNIGTNYQIIEWDLSSNTGWKNRTITHIRLDLGSTAQDVFEIDWISIGRYGVNSDEMSAGITAASSAASNAQTDATNALNQLSNIASDSILSKGEKSQVITDWNAADAEWTALLSQADGLGVDRSAYNTAHQTLSSYLVSLSPAWNDTTQDTGIVATTWRSNWTSYYNEKQKLINAIAAKASTMATYTNVNGRPQDTTNLVVKTAFEDGLPGTWVDANNNALSVVTVSGQTFSKALQLVTRDQLEVSNSFPVVVGETLYIEAWLDASTANAGVYFGCRFNNSAGGVASWYGAASLNAGVGWTRVTASMTVPSGSVTATPWLQIAAFSNFGTARAALVRISRYQSGATAGATLGVNVSGTMTNVKDYAANIGTFVSSGTARTQISDTGIRVYDGSNNLRIKIGQL